MPLSDQNPLQPAAMSGTPLPPPVSRQKHVLTIVWYVFLGLVAIGTIGEVAHGETSGFWLLALFGLPTLWLFKGLETRIKAIATGAFAFIFLCSAIFSVTPLGRTANANYQKEEAYDAQVATQKKQHKKAEEDKRQAQEDKDAAKQKATEAKEQAKQDAEQAKPVEKTGSTSDSVKEKAAPNISVPATPKAEQEIKILMKERFGDALRYVTVDSRQDGGYGVFVGFQTGNILPNGLAKISIEDNMKAAYKDLYTSDVDVHYASVSAYGTTQDKFGNESNSELYETDMMRDIGRQINWDNYSSLDFNELWTVDIINPSFQQLQ